MPNNNILYGIVALHIIRRTFHKTQKKQINSNSNCVNLLKYNY